jgi:restriction endonuclease S subunit
MYLNEEPEYIEEMELPYIEKGDCFTQIGDILVRLSAPYTAVMIKNKEQCGLVIPSHFAVIRVDKIKASPEYVYWLLKRDKNLGRIILSSSGSTALGTISSGALANLPMKVVPMRKQKAIGELLLLMEREQELLNKLSAQKEQFTKLSLEKYITRKRGKEND